VSSSPALVIATPGAEPVADKGYAAALLLDSWALLGRADLRASEEAVRRWFNASALVRARTAGGEVILVADSTLRPVQALVRWDPVGHAARELDDRIVTGMPPARRVALLTGFPASVSDLIDRAQLPTDVVTLGPTPIDDGKVRALLTASLSNALAMTKALKGAIGERSAHKATDLVRVVVDPATLGGGQRHDAGKRQPFP
jgi:primosomal protein N' (replication factor Y)